MSNLKYNTNSLFNKLNKLKKFFNIEPEINDIETFENTINKEIKIKHLHCNYEEKVILKEWISIQNRSSIDTENIGACFCTSCANKIKTDDLREHLSKIYNNEFILLSEFTGYREKVDLKHKECGAIFQKTPSQIKSSKKRLFCTNCKKSDSIYEKSVIKKRNQELKSKLKENNLTTYLPLEDCLGFTKKMKFNHTTCGSDFEAKPYDVYTYYGKHNHCPNCFKNKSNPTKVKTEKDNQRVRTVSLKSSYRKFLDYSKEFYFYPKINSFEDFEKHHNEALSITHKKCNTTVIMTFSEWSKQRHYKDFDKTAPKFIHFCEHCSEILNRKNIQKFMDKNFNKEFRIISRYKGAKSHLVIEHIRCGNTIKILPTNIKMRKLHCSKCGKKDEKTEALIQKKKNKNLIKQLKKKKLKEFIPLEDCKGLTKKMKFKHIRCGSIIKCTPQSLLNLRNKKYCNCCPEKLLSKETDIEARNELAQKALDIINNSNFSITNSYDEHLDYVLLKHNKCLEEFPISKRNLFSKEITCPHCESENFKNNRYISINEKIKAFESHLNNEYKILKPFVGCDETVPFQHKECGHIFERTISIYLRSKGKLFCPKCRHENKLKEAQDKLYNKYKGEFDFVDINKYNAARTPLNFIHNKCGTIFESNLERMTSCKTSPCPKCNDNIKNESKFKNQLYDRFKGEYILVGKFESNRRNTSFRHKKCGKLFIKTPYSVLNSDTPCTHCAKENTLLGIKEAQRKVDENSNGLFTLRGIYRGIKKEIAVTCNSCKATFISTPKNMFLKKTCDICKAKKVKKD